MSEQPKIDCWAIVDLFGHQQIAGHVTEQVIGSESMLRVDVPAMPDRPAFTRFYGVKAIYSLTPVAEEIALSAIEHLRERPITVYGLALPAPSHAQEDDGTNRLPWEDEEDGDSLAESEHDVTCPYEQPTCNCLAASDDTESELPF